MQAATKNPGSQNFCDCHLMGRRHFKGKSGAWRLRFSLDGSRCSVKEGTKICPWQRGGCVWKTGWHVVCSLHELVKVNVEAGRKKGLLERWGFSSLKSPTTILTGMKLYPGW